MNANPGLLVAGVILVAAAAAAAAAAVVAWRRLRRLRDRASVNGDYRSLGRDTALVIGAFCAIVVVVAVTALQFG